MKTGYHIWEIAKTKFYDLIRGFHLSLIHNFSIVRLNCITDKPQTRFLYGNAQTYLPLVCGHCLVIPVGIGDFSNHFGKPLWKSCCNRSNFH